MPTDDRDLEQPAVTPATAPELNQIIEQLRSDNDRLRALVSEMLPVFVADVRAGLELGEPPAGHDDDCEDCVWYRQSRSRRDRLDAGEFKGAES